MKILLPKFTQAFLRSRPYLPLFFISLAFFALEIATFSGLRFATYFFRAQLVLAISLLGLTIGGVGASLVKNSKIDQAFFFGTIALTLTPLAAFSGILLAPISFWGSAILLHLAFIPYGVLIGLYYRTLDPVRTYVIELLGGAMGLFASLFLLPLLREENLFTFIFLCLVGVLIVFHAQRFSTSWKRLGAFALALAAVALAVTHLQYDYLNLAKITPCRWPQNQTALPKLTCQRDAFPVYRVIRSYGSLVDRIDITDFGQGMLHTAFAGDSTDGMKPYPALPYHRIDARLPYGIVENPKTLIVGTAAEGVVKVVKAVGATQITSVDVNPAITRLWTEDREIIDYALAPFRDVKLQTIDGRTFLDHSNETFDLITMMNTHRSRDAGAFGEPDFLHTKEAFIRFWRHLSPWGIFSFEEKRVSAIAEGAIRRTAASAVAALRHEGTSHPEEHIVAYEWVGALSRERAERLGTTTQLTLMPFVQFLVKKTPWSPADIEQLEAWSREAARTDNLVMPINMVFKRWLWLPHRNELVAESGRYLWPALTGIPPDSISILTDDRPFPIALTSVAKQDFRAAVLLFGLIVVIILAWWYAVSPGASTLGQTLRRLPIYFAAIGMGYMFIEIALIQWLQHYLGIVTLNLAIAIGGLLVASAMGNIIFPKLRNSMRYSMLAYGILTAIVIFFPWLITRLAFEPLWVRVLLALALVAAVGVALGTFFPRGISLARTHAAGKEPVLVGLNGGAMAMAVPLGFYLGSIAGISWTALLGVSVSIAAFLYLEWQYPLSPAP